MTFFGNDDKSETNFYYFTHFSRGHHLAIIIIGKELYWFRLISAIVHFSCQVEFWFAWIHIFLTFRVFFLSHSLGNWKLLVCIKPAGRYEKWNRKHTGNWISYWKYTPYTIVVVTCFTTITLVSAWKFRNLLLDPSLWFNHNLKYRHQGLYSTKLVSVMHNICRIKICCFTKNIPVCVEN